MSASKAFVATTALAAMCGSPSEDPAPAPASYACEHAFDVGCRYRADVALTGGTLATASIQPLPGFGARSEGAFDGLEGTVTVRDTLGQLAPVTCDFSVDLDFLSETADGSALVEVSGAPTFDAGCPLSCGWFLPGSGSFDADAGHFRLKMFEGQWELEFGDSAADEPEYGPLWLWTGTSQVSYDAGVTLTAPVPVTGGEWSVPMDLSAGSQPAGGCAP